MTDVAMDAAALRHTLATLAYRAGKVLRDAPAGFGSFAPAPGSRTASQILAHMGDLFDWAVSLADGQHVWRETPPGEWAADVQRFFDGVRRFDDRLASDAPPGFSAERLFQGPIADALTHVGQLAMMRRLAGAPMRGENYFKADIASGRVGVVQPAPGVEFD